MDNFKSKKSSDFINKHKNLIDNNFVFARKSVDSIKTKNSDGRIKKINKKTVKGVPVLKVPKGNKTIKYSFNNEYEIITIIKKQV